MRRRGAAILVILALGLGVASVHWGHGRRFWFPGLLAWAGGQTHEEVLARLGPTHRPRLREAARATGSTYPPAALRLVGLKEEKSLEVWFKVADGWQRARTYAVLAASGGPGPKLREGDLQVPEGIYRLTAFNPNSSYHLSVRVDYPSAEDRAVAARENRTNLGGDIFIHGKAVSIGCLAIGDAAIEELYVLLADTGLRNSLAILAPSADPKPPKDAPEWVASLYGRLRNALAAVRSPGAGRGSSRTPSLR